MGILTNNNTNSDQGQVADFYFPSFKSALIIFTRNPELGKCKTRLAKTIGDEGALEIYKHLLVHTAETAKKVAADRYVFYSENIQKKDIWDPEFFKKKLQEGSDLGERMENAFSELFQLGYEKVLIIGSDLLDLNAELISEGFQKLNQYDYVLGPAEDGGYYLLGMKKLHPNIFRNKEWGTETVQKDTLNDLQNEQTILLKILNDIDTFEDIEGIESLKKYYTYHD
ncbi:TIGR04282 family arsenosugar biosynthesis glycosyltransferase [Bizionia myxarmorum]|uniref:Glycosyltransferase n=1 Tax=Bizionia myxarmorum TaxID=291186 RepID=A0A5D0RC95_9FLAO|nr:TIGR04282 family arsenosugar biosynthesis glycosyltransferase [Bizionia myxarmorum]TYB79142.1 glycosyltransferase [Bizionia myxarmorum]